MVKRRKGSYLAIEEACIFTTKYLSNKFTTHSKHMSNNGQCLHVKNPLK